MYTSVEVNLLNHAIPYPIWSKSFDTITAYICFLNVKSFVSEAFA
jgi:hypothetical protein